MRLFPAPDEHGRRVLDIRWPDDPDAEAPAWKAHKETRKWAELTNTISRLMRLGAQILPGTKLERGRIFFEMLDPGAALAWDFDQSPYRQRFVRLHLPLRTNPGAMVYAGTESVNMLPGQLTLVRNAMSSAINLGDFGRIHLCLDIRAEVIDTERRANG